MTFSLGGKPYTRAFIIHKQFTASDCQSELGCLYGPSRGAPLKNDELRLACPA